MDTADIEKIYDQTNANGLAIATAAGEVVDNQLFVSGEGATKLAVALAKIFNGLAAVGRSVSAFVLNCSRGKFLAVPTGDHILILEVSPHQSLDEVMAGVRSVVGVSAPTPVAAAPAVTASQPIGEAAGGTPTTPAEHLWPDLRADLVKVMARVAPRNLAEKLIKEAEQSVTNGQSVTRLEQIFEIGRRATLSVPNPARRKLVEKELGLLATKYGLTG